MCKVELPERLNVATVFVDSHLQQGRAEKAAIVCGEQTITYKALSEGVNRVGNALLGLGIRIEERVAIIMPDCPECVYAFFGAMKIGAVAIPMNTLLMPADYEYLLNDSRAQVLVIHSSLLDRVESIRSKLRYVKHVIVVGEGAKGDLSFEELTASASDEMAPADTSKDDSAFWLYSSGTTGFPKGAIHLHHDMVVAADLYAQQTIGLAESDVSFSVAKLFFAYGLGNGLYFPLRTGGATVLLPDRPVPKKVYEVIDRYQPTVFYSVPTSYAALLHLAEKERRTDLGKVRMCVSAGEPLPKPIFEKWLDRFGVEIYDGIGSTEILHIFVGEVGALLIKGDSIANGYWNKHEQTKKTFRGEWINTHDKFHVDEDGYYWYAGRTDDMMKVSGLAVWPADVESILASHDAVLESGVVGVPNKEGLIKPRAYVVLKDKSAASDDLVKELQTFVKTNAHPHKYPRTIIFVDELPKTATGKIKRYKLREMAQAEG